MSDKQYVVVRESLTKSVLRGIFSVASLVAMVGIGIVLDSQALQWLGAICWLIMAISRGSGRLKTMTAEQAIDFIKSGEQT